MKDLDVMFDENGNFKQDIEFYFDDNGDSEFWNLVSNNYEKFSPNSDIVKLYYAESYASETHGNYCARTLFYRAY